MMPNFIREVFETLLTGGAASGIVTYNVECTTLQTQTAPCSFALGGPETRRKTKAARRGSWAPRQRCPAPKGNTVKTTPVIAAAATLALASALVSCSAGGGTDGDGGGGGNDATNCTNKITKTDLPVVTMWAWYPN